MADGGGFLQEGVTARGENVMWEVQNARIRAAIAVRNGGGGGNCTYGDGGLALGETLKLQNGEKHQLGKGRGGRR